MGEYLKMIAGVALLMFIVAMVGSGLLYENKNPQTQRVFQHELAPDADPNLGLAEIPPDHMVDESFVSHLPLIVIDTGGEKLIDYSKIYDAETDSFHDPAGVELLQPVTLSFIDHENHVNSLADIPEMKSAATLKIRGNTSASSRFPKKQFSIRLLDTEKNENPLPLLGMDSGGKWVLNATVIDGSYLRNYLAMNMGALLFPYTPDMRFCEVIVKKGSGYEYHGLYILYEAVGRGKGRIDISGYAPKDDYHSYILRRDRYDEKETMLHTYGLENGYYTTCFEVQYPGKTRITQETVDQIQEEINLIERALYADDEESFLQYRNYLDLDSFVDYFVVNEMFGNYDAGLHSTYLYKEAGGKLAMAALWDYDMVLDNWDKGLFNIRETALDYQPWFDRLMLDDEFVRRVNRRYQTLRTIIYTDDELLNFIKDAEDFLGNAVRRDQSRWDGEYMSPVMDLTDQNSGLLIQRQKETLEEEIQRLEDVLLHLHYLDDTPWQAVYGENAMVRGHRFHGLRELTAVLFFLSFFVSIVLVQRYRKGL